MRTLGTYSSSWSLPSNVRLATISRPTSRYPSVDALPAGDDGEDDHPEAVDKAGLEQGTAEREVADNAQPMGAVCLQRPTGLDRVLVLVTALAADAPGRLTPQMTSRDRPLSIS